MKKKIEKLIDAFEESLKQLEFETNSRDFDVCLGRCIAYADVVYMLSGDAYLCSMMFQKVDKVKRSKEAAVK